MKLPMFMRMRSLLRSLRKERNVKYIEEDFNSCVPAVLLPVDLLERIFRELPAEVIPTLWDVCRSWRNAVYLRRNRLPRIRRKQIIVRYGITNDRLESELRRRSPLKGFFLLRSYFIRTISVFIIILPVPTLKVRLHNIGIQ
uniref:F-box domain-containing protein n=1 Tax=Ascaris lumbricoides TaxID=6252 RepID=A0A0M3IVM2_ASCLU